MKRRLALAAIAAITVTACTPLQIAAFHASTPEVQQQWLADLAHANAVQQWGEAVNANAAAASRGDCYSALSYFSGSHSTARRVIHRESRNNPAAQNTSSSAAGCWQLLAIHDWRYAAVGCSATQKYQAVCNTKAADHLYRAAGWSPWGF